MAWAVRRGRVANTRFGPRRIEVSDLGGYVPTLDAGPRWFEFAETYNTDSAYWT